MVYANPESVLENDTLKLLWDFEIQMDHQILAWRPDLIIIHTQKKKKKKKKKTSRIMDFALSDWPQSKIERKREG